MSIEHANHGKGWKKATRKATWIRDPKLFEWHLLAVAMARNIAGRKGRNLWVHSWQHATIPN